MAPQPNGLASHGVQHPHQHALSAMVIGMGPAGMGAALSLTALGFRVHVVERDTLTDQGAGAASTPSQVCATQLLAALQKLLNRLLHDHKSIFRVREWCCQKSASAASRSARQASADPLTV